MDHHKTAAIRQSLQSMGFSEGYISRAIVVHRKSKRGTDYDIAWLIAIIERLKSKDKCNKKHIFDEPQQFQPCFGSMDQALSFLDLKKGNAVDYRYENGRFLLCEIQSIKQNYHEHTVLSLHPMGLSVHNTKHDRVCNLYHQYHRIRAPKSVSLRTISSKSHSMNNVHIDSYVDINPIHRKGMLYICIVIHCLTNIFRP